MRRTNQQERDPEATARAVRSQHGHARIPVPVEQIARALGTELHFRPFTGDISGMLFRDTARKIVGVNSAHPYTRQRFTIAHELGHLLLHEGRAITVDKAARVTVRINARDSRSSLATDREEIAANQFAAALLMPEEIVQREVDRARKGALGGNVEETVAQLAAIFDVSSSAMRYRLINLGVLAPE